MKNIVRLASTGGRSRPDSLRRMRQELAYLGKSGQQTTTLLALNAVEEANLAYAPNVSPQEKDRRLKIWATKLWLGRWDKRRGDSPVFGAAAGTAPSDDQPWNETPDQKARRRAA